jgi:DNA mismatch repair protein MutL
MSNLIKILPDHIANQIAAGEVVQRPASVVKELLENAIDAGAKSIKLIIKDAGKTLIQVIDDGKGMNETDARMCFERHATSKIDVTEDIFQIKTMGFRGEALASIAAVARVELKTKQANQELGTSIIIESSHVSVQEPCQTTIGTSISVKNLFYNIPVRRNFLKADNVELRHIIDEFQQIALAHPELFFSLHHNAEKLFHLPASNLRQRVVAVFGQKYNEILIPIKEDTDIIKVYGFVGKPEFVKKNRGEQFFFVNNRFIKNSYLNHAIMQAYTDIIPEKTYPLYIIFFELDPSKIDINVHPTKQEIKFEDEKLVYNFLKVSVRHALAQFSLYPAFEFDQEPSLSVHLDNSISIEYTQDSEIIESKISGSNDTAFFESKIGSVKSGSNTDFGGKIYREVDQRDSSNLKNWEKLYNGFKRTDDNDIVDSSENNFFEFESKLSNIDSVSEDNYTGSSLIQLPNGFILYAQKSGIMIIDPSAAHQRILYEKYLNSFNKKTLLPQQQLFPKTINLSSRDANLLLEILPELNLLGIEIGDFGNNTFVVNALPMEMSDENIQKIIEDLLEQYQLGIALKLDIYQNLARALSVQHSLKVGKKLSILEMQKIIDDLFATEVPYSSPVGKKTIVKFDLQEIYQKFES